VGALSVLMPALEERGQRPSVILGTSVGAINAAFIAANAHLPAGDALDAGRDRWESITMRDVVEPILLQQAPKTALRYAGEFFGVPGVHLRGLLDPSPLEGTLARWIDWDALHRNVRSDALDAVGVVATAVASERSVVFAEGAGRHLPRRTFTAEYVGTRLRTEHVRASAAIPAVFPPVRIEHPKAAASWYFDGGTRLNTPIKPIIDLGVDRVVVIGVHSVKQPPGIVDGPEPDFADGALELIQATLVDPLTADIRMLGKVNLLIGAGAKKANDYRRERGKRPFKKIPYVFVAPEEPNALGKIADRVFEDRDSGADAVRSPDLALLSRLVGGEGRPHGELLSYLFFDGGFAAELIELGRRDAQRWLDEQGDDPWRVDPIEPES
jgi:NTE family protein